MKDEYIIPKEWYLKVDDSNINIINNWRARLSSAPNDPLDEKYKYISHSGWGVIKPNPFEGTEINMEIFKKYILNYEDLSYLKKLFED